MRISTKNSVIRSHGIHGHIGTQRRCAKDSVGPGSGKPLVQGLSDSEARPLSIGTLRVRGDLLRVQGLGFRV